MEQSGLDPGHWDMEITERPLIRDTEETLDVLRGLKDRGLQLSLDDVGTERSSVSYGQRVPIDTLNIDRSFREDMTTTRQARSLVNAMTHRRHRHVVGTGVETKEPLTR